LGDKIGEAIMLSNIGYIYSDLGEKQKALKYYNQSLQIFKQLGNKEEEASLLGSISSIYSALNKYREAIEFGNQALLINRQIGAKEDEAAQLNDLGSFYDTTGEKEKALESYNKALPLWREVGNKNGESATIYGLSSPYYDLGQKEKALDYLKTALSLRQQAGKNSAVATTSESIARLYFELGEKGKALDYINQAVLVCRQIGERRCEADELFSVATFWYTLGNKRLSIYFYKQSVNLYQQLRSNIVTFDKETQKTFLNAVSNPYRELVHVLIEEGRVAEAEQVLGMLKEEELFDYVRRDDKAARELRENIKLTPTETETFQRYEEIADSITRIGKEFDVLEQESKNFPVGKFPRQAELEKLDAQLADARKVFNKFLEELDAQFRNKETKGRDDRVAQISGTKALLDSLNQPRTVIISTIAGEDHLNLIVTTSKINRAHTVDIKAADLNSLVADFRNAVKNPQIDPRPSGKKLYDVLFPADLQKDLAGVDADTIVWSLDGALRYAPIAALWDGKQYLAERYANAVITLVSRDKIDKTPAARTNWTALGVGVSKQFENFPALAAVPKELCRVVNDPTKSAECLKLTGGKEGVVIGTDLRDEEFTLQNFKQSLGRYPIVHIASHFRLNVGNESDSYLLLGGGKTNDERKLTIAALREQLDNKFVGTELLVLSACNTGMSAGENSNGAEIEGFGALAQIQGAKTVVASLWSVADESTMELMTEFYRILETDPKIGKAEALQRVQQEMIAGKLKPSQIKGGRRDTSAADAKTAATDYSHPYYWSSFILIGNWR
jgi:CHAT domain-containing protein